MKARVFDSGPLLMYQDPGLFTRRGSEVTHWVNPDLRALSIIVSANGLTRETVAKAKQNTLLYPGRVHAVGRPEKVPNITVLCLNKLECVEPLNVLLGGFVNK